MWYPNAACTVFEYLLGMFRLFGLVSIEVEYADGVCIFDGKIGMWPFVKDVAAQRGSINRPAGTIERKCVVVTKEVYRDYMINKVIPAIKEKWPDQQELRRGINIQQDGAKTHHRDDDPLWAAAARDNRRLGGCTIHLETQPANSPDTNECDLSFFCALQSDQWNHGFETTVDGLISQVLRAFDEFEPRKLEFGFLTHQCCLNEILATYGMNNYKSQGILPRRIQVSDEAMEVAILIVPELEEED
jgi:hypothetical protein